MTSNITITRVTAHSANLLLVKKGRYIPITWRNSGKIIHYHSLLYLHHLLCSRKPESNLLSKSGTERRGAMVSHSFGAAVRLQLLSCCCSAHPASSLTEPRVIQGQWLGWDLSAAQIGTWSNGAAYPQPTKTPAAPLRRQPNQLRRLIAKSLPDLINYLPSIQKVI